MVGGHGVWAIDDQCPANDLLMAWSRSIVPMGTGRPRASRTLPSHGTTSRTTCPLPLNVSRLQIGMSLSATVPVGIDCDAGSVMATEDLLEKSRGEKPASAAAPAATLNDSTITRFFDRRDWPRLVARAPPGFAWILADEGSIASSSIRTRCIDRDGTDWLVRLAADAPPQVHRVDLPRLRETTDIRDVPRLQLQCKPGEDQRARVRRQILELDHHTRHIAAQTSLARVVDLFDACFYREAAEPRVSLSATFMKQTKMLKVGNQNSQRRHK
jgi:hypothetical protein